MGMSRNGAARVLNGRFPTVRVWEKDLRELEKRNEIPPLPSGSFKDALMATSDARKEAAEAVTRESYYLAKAFLRLLALKHGISVADIEEAHRVISAYERDRKNEAYRAALDSLGAKGGK